MFMSVPNACGYWVVSRQCNFLAFLVKAKTHRIRSKCIKAVDARLKNAFKLMETGKET